MVRVRVRLRFRVKVRLGKGSDLGLGSVLWIGLGLHLRLFSNVPVGIRNLNFSYIAGTNLPGNILVWYDMSSRQLP